MFILTDLDRAECPPNLRNDWIANAKLAEPLPIKMCFNIAVKEVEAWLIADKDNLGDYLGVPSQAFPDNTEMDDPKELLLHCVRRHGSREAKSALLPSGAPKVGLGYNVHLSEFATHRWSFHAAAQRSASLERAMRRIAAHQN